MERATSLSSEEVAHYQRTGMIGTATVADDEEVLVILCSMRVNLISCSRIEHFHLWGTCQFKRYHFSDKFGKVIGCPRDAVAKISFGSRSCGSVCLRKLENYV